MYINRNVPQSGELMHFGVKGMKWGVRRYQNADGSLTDAGKKRLKVYKKSELRKLDSKYKVDKLNKKRIKIENKYANDPSEKANQKIARARYNQLYNEGMRYLERRAVKKMKFSDMKKEQNAVTKAMLRKTAYIGLGGFAVGMLSGRPTMIVSVDNDTVKTDQRVSAKDKLYIEKTARQSTGYKGWY